MPISRLIHSRLSVWIPAVAIIALGAIITPHYGESWDERQFFKYAVRALEAYTTWPASGDIPLTGNTYDNYGPAYVMLTALGGRLLSRVVPGYVSDLRHFIYFLTFLLGVWSFFHLCRRWMSHGAAGGAALLLATQPVIWGHAFISPKDIPFLAFFVLSVLLGFRMVDAFAEQGAASSVTSAPRLVIVLTIAALAIILALFLATHDVRLAVERLVGEAAAGETNIVSRLASDVRTSDPALYVSRFFVWFLRLRFGLALLFALWLFALWRKQPGGLHQIGKIAPAAIVLGFNTSIRILGPFAGLIVAAYALYRLRRSALPVLLAYAALAVVTMYLTWPYLWPDPVGHLVESALVMSRYPWRGEVLFAGHTFPSTDLPASYLPVLLAVQFTETAWLAILAGFVLAIVQTVRRNKTAAELFVLASMWCIVPAAGFALSRAPLYDNFRQVLFIVPPLFMLAGWAFEQVRGRVRIAVIAVAVLPSLIAGALLHPYEYIYYNQLVGGVRGAFRAYELDYWGTSYREAAGYLGLVAPANSSVWVEGPTHLLQLYARPDLKIHSTYESARLESYDYVVALTRSDLDLKSFPGAPVVHVIQRDGAVLTVIKKP